MKKIVRVKSSAVVMATLCFGSLVALPQSSSSQMIQPFHLENDFGSYNVLRDIANSADIGIGLQEVEPQHETTFTFDFP
jgi:hypothetical protein